ncbi:hypothetical protein EDC01DRAFT_635855 [Geopyxis carbonaria]|nr:hypothetical protein EDC01DRAFT_635855 [Geopyxis carbonaria]
MVRPDRFKASKGSVKKLNRTNYCTWSKHLLDIVESVDHLDVLLGRKPRPECLSSTASQADKTARELEQGKWDTLSAELQNSGYHSKTVTTQQLADKVEGSSSMSSSNADKPKQRL